MDVALKLLWLGSALLMGVLWLELKPTSHDYDLTKPAAVAPPEKVAVVAVQTRHEGDPQRTILERPLFTPERRPSSSPEGERSLTAELPRLTAVVVHGSNRFIILAPAEGGKLVVAGEGSRIGKFTVQAIQAGEVAIAGPDGVSLLRPTFEFLAPVGRAPSLP